MPGADVAAVTNRLATNNAASQVVAVRNSSAVMIVVPVWRFFGDDAA